MRSQLFLLVLAVATSASLASNQTRSYHNSTLLLTNTTHTSFTTATISYTTSVGEVKSSTSMLLSKVSASVSSIMSTSASNSGASKSLNSMVCATLTSDHQHSIEPPNSQKTCLENVLVSSVLALSSTADSSHTTPYPTSRIVSELALNNSGQRSNITRFLNATPSNLTSLYSNATKPTSGPLQLNTTTLTNSINGNKTIPASVNIGPYRNLTSSKYHSNSTNTTAPSVVSDFLQVDEVIAAKSSTPTKKAKKVFAHYMLGTVNQVHAQQDIDEAIAMGLDGFAFNIGDPSQSFISESLDNLIGYAEYRNFKFYISLDVYASGNACYQGNLGACGGPRAYDWILKSKLQSSAWYKGPNGNPMISTYSSGGEHNDTWADWKEYYAQTMYFIPDFDETAGYYEAAPGWYEYWGDICDGIMSWEAAWPYRSGFGGLSPGDISPDLPVLAAATNHSKGYMMSLSPLQYKNSYGARVYRAGDLNLPIRMENILAMDESPDFIQIITWNDGPEGHYIGNLWFEQNNDTQPYKYANSIQWPHSGWQPIITAFIDAWKAGKLAGEMEPPSGQPAVGALWYKTILQDSVCPIDENPLVSNYSMKPDGFETGIDQLNYAVVVEVGGSGYSLQPWSNGVALTPVQLVPGLNYGSFTGIQAGYQRLEMYKNGAIVLAATGGRCISAGCPDCIYNMNLQVVPLIEDTGAQGTCPYAVCKKQVFAHYMVGNILPEHVRQDVDDAAKMGLDGFALNVGDPAQSFVRDTFDYMFDYVRDNYPNFFLYISMDLWAEGNAYNGVDIDKYHDLLRDFKGHDAYLKGPDGKSFVSTFSSGGLHDTHWSAWRESWNDEIYLVPDFDDTAGYNTSDPGWWGYWGDLVQGVFSWETTWPKVGIETYSDDIDQIVIDGTYKHVKSYMVPLSPLQYKDSYDTNYIRGGGLNLPRRMESILTMNPKPDYVEYITWNDGPESHYIGNLWLEQNNDTQPLLYANSDSPHTAWQPLIMSFIAAFKASRPPSLMVPPNGATAVGAMWYNSILSTSVCENEAYGGYYAKPKGFETIKDELNFAVVLQAGLTGVTMRATSNGRVLSQILEVNPGGMTYGSFNGISAGFQKMELVASDGSVLMTAAGGRCISNECPDCIYNLNPVVVGFGSDPNALGSCTQRDCKALLNNVIYVDPIVWEDPYMAGPPPCTMVLPPSKLATPSVITFPEFITTLEVGWLGSNGYTSITTTTKLTIPHYTATIISFWNVRITTGQETATIYPTTSILPPAFVITDVYPAGITNVPVTRTINPPPYPWSLSGTDNAQNYTYIVLNGRIVTVVPGDQVTTTVNSIIITIGSSQVIIAGSTIPIPTSTQTVIAGITIGDVLPVYTTYPSATIGVWTLPVPAPTVVTTEGKREPVIPCTAWFFFFCISGKIEGLVLFGYHFPGIYPRGGPPGIKPPGGGIIIPPIEWPPITIGWDYVPTYAEMEDDVCETTTISGCTTYLTYSVDSKGSTTATATTSACKDAPGCSPTVSDITTTSTVTPEATPTNYIVWPVDGIRSQVIDQIVAVFYAEGVSATHPDYYVSRGNVGTNFWYTPLTASQLAAVKRSSAVQDVTLAVYIATAPQTFTGQSKSVVSAPNTGVKLFAKDALGSAPNTSTPVKLRPEENSPKIEKRATATQVSAPWQLVSLSQPPGVSFLDMKNEYMYDPTAGLGQVVYLVDTGAYAEHPEFTSIGITTSSYLYAGPQPVSSPGDFPMFPNTDRGAHGTCMLSLIIGRTVGIARNAKPIIVRVNPDRYLPESFLDGLSRVYDHILANGNQGKAVVNLSFNFKEENINLGLKRQLGLLIQRIIAENVVVVTGSGNSGVPVDGYPALFGSAAAEPYIPNLIIAGGIGEQYNAANEIDYLRGCRYRRSQTAGYVNINAPAYNVKCARNDNLELLGAEAGYKESKGTSDASAIVTGLVAYFLSLNPGTYTVRSMKEKIEGMQWSRKKGDNDYPNMIWNGQNSGLCPANRNINDIKRRDCSSPPSITLGLGAPITFKSGSPNPTCTGTGCGTYCSIGPYCNAPCAGTCGGENPDFEDPANPDSPQHSTTPTATKTTSKIVISTKEAVTPTKEPPQPTSDPDPINDPPLPTTPPSRSPYCFRDHNSNERWTPFSENEAFDLINRICVVSDNLSPSNTFGYAFRGKTGLLASITWAENQSGCSPKAAMPLHEFCEETFLMLLDKCDPSSRVPMYGGAFVDNIDYGCVTWWLGLDSTARLRQEVQNSVEIIEPSEQAALLGKLAKIELELPRLMRESKTVIA